MWRRRRRSREAAKRGSCVFIGRCADYILKSRPDVLRVFVYADRDIRLRRAIDEYGDLEEHIDEFMHQTDKRRRIYYENYTNQRWGDRENYDLMLNSGDLGIEKCVELICQAVEGITLLLEKCIILMKGVISMSYLRFHP